MKKIFIILLSTFLLFGCSISKNDEYYKKVSDTIVSFYNDSSYDKNDFDSDDIDAIDEYLSTLTHDNQEIDITEYVNSSSTTTNEKNTAGVYSKNNKWYIKYNDLNFIDDFDIEPYAIINCDGKTFTLFSSSFYPDYETTTNDDVYNYVYIGSQIDQNVKKYAYRSSYDGSGLIVTLKLNNNIEKISTSFENVDEFISSTSSESSNIILIIIIIVIIIIGIFFTIKLLYKIKNRNNDY